MSRPSSSASTGATSTAAPTSTASAWCWRRWPRARGSTWAIRRAPRARRTVPNLSSVPDELRAELSHLLQPDPAQRPSSMAALVAGGRPHAGASGGLGRKLKLGASVIAILVVLGGAVYLGRDMVSSIF